MKRLVMELVLELLTIVVNVDIPTNNQVVIDIYSLTTITLLCK